MLSMGHVLIPQSDLRYSKQTDQVREKEMVDMHLHIYIYKFIYIKIYILSPS